MHLQLILCSFIVIVIGTINCEKITGIDYMEKKWGMWFNFIDIHHRGVISKEEAQEQGDTFADLSHLSEKKETSMKKKLNKIWDQITFRGAKQITKKTFVETNRKLYTNDKAKFEDEMRTVYTAFFSNVVDLKHEGFVTAKEYADIATAIGQENMKDSFNMYDLVEGKIPLNELIESWVLFTSSDDSSKKDIVKETITRYY